MRYDFNDNLCTQAQLQQTLIDVQNTISVPKIEHLCVDYIDELYHTMMKATKKQFEKASEELSNMSPAPMHTMFERQSRAKAIKKKINRQKMVVANVPPTNGMTKTFFI